MERWKRKQKIKVAAAVKIQMRERINAARRSRLAPV